MPQRYSFLLRPFLYVVDLSVITLCAQLLSFSPHNYLLFVVFMVSGWLITTTVYRFYEVYRFTPFLKILYLLAGQLVLLATMTFAFFGLFNTVSSRDWTVTLEYLGLCALLISIAKLGLHNFLKKYRVLVGRNYRRVVIVGINQQTKHLREFFELNPAYGYEFQGLLDLEDNGFSLEKLKKFVLDHEVDEIYCSVSELKNKELNDIIRFADNNLKVVKFLPDNRGIFSKKLKYQYYGITPVLSLRSLPIDSSLNQFIKRSLDIFISLIAIVGILWWLTPILAIFIKIESKGPVFYKQSRNGLSGKPFSCYKFRSMVLNDDREAKQVVKNDLRVTKTGLFLRKTSIDELPQFINVLLGEMSVVGPRPHPLTQTKNFAGRIDKFMVRHLVKPGITGLAQISGCRGEVETVNHIKNRLRFDIFYLENWSILMDLRIIAKTVVQICKGDSKAY